MSDIRKRIEERCEEIRQRLLNRGAQPTTVASSAPAVPVDELKEGVDYHVNRDAASNFAGLRWLLKALSRDSVVTTPCNPAEIMDFVLQTFGITKQLIEGE